MTIVKISHHCILKPLKNEVRSVFKYFLNRNFSSVILHLFESNDVLTDELISLLIMQTKI